MDNLEVKINGSRNKKFSKYSLGTFNDKSNITRLDTTEVRMSECEDKSVEITQTKEKTRKRIKRGKDRVFMSYGTISNDLTYM